jgi:hypothetical protein
MSFRTSVYLPAAVLAAGALMLGAAAGASAHEHRAVGNYELTVGFLNEPALLNEPNGLSLEVMFFADGVAEEDAAEGEHAEEEGEPVEGLEETLQAEVIVGGGANTKELQLEAAFGEPGAYEGMFIPTLAGDYTFHIFGEIDGTPVDESFDSGPETFSSVESLEDLEFPNTVADPATLSSTVADLQAQVDSIDSGGSSSDSTARTLGAVAIVAGLLGLGAGSFAALKRSG